MSDKKCKKKIVLISVIVSIVLILCVIIFVIISTKNKVSELDKMKNMLTNVFIYLEDKEYNDLNEIPDYCKLSFIYGSDYLKSDALLSTDDYDTVLNKRNGKSVDAYSKENIMNTIKKVLGENATISFEQDEYGDYPSLIENGCGYENNSIGLLSYNEEKEYVYSINDSNEDKVTKLYVKWETPEIDGDDIKLIAYALITSRRDDGSYEVYADGNLELYAGEIDKDEDVEEAINGMYNVSSRKYTFNLKKVDGKYMWTGFSITDNLYKEIIVE